MERSPNDDGPDKGKPRESAGRKATGLRQRALLRRLGCQRTMKKSLVLAAMIGVCGLVFSLEGSSQSSANAIVTFRIAPLMSLSVWGESPSGSSVASIYTMPHPTAQERQAGFLERLNALKLVVRSNLSWALRVRALEPDMGLSDDGTYRKPVSDLEVRAAPAPYVAVTTHDQAIASGPHGEHRLSLDYRVRLGPEHRNGTYRVTLIYTLASP